MNGKVSGEVVAPLSHVRFIIPEQTVNNHMIDAVQIASDVLSCTDMNCYPNLSHGNPYELVHGISAVSPAKTLLNTETINQQNPSVTSVILLKPSLLAESTIPEIKAMSITNFTSQTLSAILEPMLKTFRARLGADGHTTRIGQPFLFSAPTSLPAGLATLSPKRIPPRGAATLPTKDATHWEASLGSGGSIILAETDHAFDDVLAHFTQQAAASGHSGSAAPTISTMLDGVHSPSASLPHADVEKTLAIIVNSNLTHLTNEYKDYWRNAIKEMPHLTNGDMIKHPYHQGLLQLNVRNAARLGYQVVEMLGLEGSFNLTKDAQSIFHDSDKFTPPIMLTQNGIQHMQMADVSVPSFNSFEETVVHHNGATFNPVAINHPSWSSTKGFTPLVEEPVGRGRERILKAVSTGVGRGHGVGKVADHSLSIGTYLTPLGDFAIWKPSIHERYGIHGPTALFPKNDPHFKANQFRMNSEYQTHLDAAFNHICTETKAEEGQVLFKRLLMYESREVDVNKGA